MHLYNSYCDTFSPESMPWSALPSADQHKWTRICEDALDMGQDEYERGFEDGGDEGYDQWLF